MNMQIDYETERELGIDYETLAVKVADKVLEMEKCPYDAQVNLVLTDNEEIERVNTEFRDIARPTDVLSFPMGENGVYDTNHSTGAKVLGDIVLSMEKAVEQADRYAHSLEREVGYLTAHSVLHLLGYDHEQGGMDRVRMREKEEQVMTQLGLPSSSSYVMDEDEE